MEMERDNRIEQEQVREAGLTESNGHVELHSELDLTDHHDTLVDSLHEDDHKTQDYSGYTKHQLVDLIKDLSKDTDFKKVESLLREIKPVFDDLREKQKNEALLKFISAGGTAAAFLPAGILLSPQKKETVLDETVQANDENKKS